MQPTLVVTAPVPGMIFINGRFAGEAQPQSPLLAPVAPYGPVYLELRPLQAGFLPMARRFVLSGGAPMPESLSEGLFAILWPGSIVELECSPELLAEERTEQVAPEGRAVLGSHPRFELQGRSFALPPGALAPRVQRLPSAVVLTGSAGDSRYLIALSPDGSRQTGLLQAGTIEFESPDVVRTVDIRDDVAGHGTQERWQLTADGPALIASELIWADGVPRRPASPEEAARAAIEAALMNRLDEAESYLSPALQPRISLESIAQTCELALPLRYGLPGGQPAIGLLHLEEESFARVRPMFFQAAQIGGEWLLTELFLDPEP